MFRILAFFTVTLLSFSMMPSTSAQQNSVQEQAETDALRDVDHDTPKEVLFMLGLAGSSTGLVAGCVGGCVLGTFIDDRIYFAHDDPLTNCGIPGAILLGVAQCPPLLSHIHTIQIHHWSDSSENHLNMLGSIPRSIDQKQYRFGKGC